MAGSNSRIVAWCGSPPASRLRGQNPAALKPRRPCDGTSPDLMPKTPPVGSFSRTTGKTRPSRRPCSRKASRTACVTSGGVSNCSTAFLSRRRRVASAPIGCSLHRVFLWTADLERRVTRGARTNLARRANSTNTPRAARHFRLLLCPPGAQPQHLRWTRHSILSVTTTAFHRSRFAMTFRPKYITFDCYGTLTYFPMHQMAYDIYEGQLPPEQMRLFVKDFAAYRFDEVMGDWKPYHADHPVGAAAHLQAPRPHLPRRRRAAGLRRRTDLGPARRRAACAHPRRQENSAGDPVQRHERADPLTTWPSCRRRSTRSTPRRMPRLQAAPASLRVHARPARLCTRGLPARFRQPALRHLPGPEPGYREQGVRQPRP